MGSSIVEMLTTDYLTYGEREYEFSWKPEIRLYLWCKFQLGKPLEAWFRHGNPCAMFEPPERTEDTTYTDSPDLLT